MNIKQAKTIPIEHYLSQKGHEPKRRSSDQLWYCSPLRHENTPSFKVNLGRNQWYDFGLGAGGDLLDLVKAMEGLHSVADVLGSLSSMGGTPPIISASPKIPEVSPTPATSSVVSVTDVTSPSLVRYLKSRCLKMEELPSCLREVHYTRGDKAYFGLGIENDAGGFEIRSEQFKGTVGPKAISTLPGTGSSVMVFEGIIDYLTAAQIHESMPTSIILNSVAMVHQAVAKIQSLRVNRVDVYRDNDAAGKAMLEALEASLPGVAVVDRAEQYQHSKDLNEWFVMGASGVRIQPKTSKQR